MRLSLRRRADRILNGGWVSLLMLWGGSLWGGGLERHGRALWWEGQPIQLVGYSYYGLLADRRFDSAGFLDILAAHNLNFTRFFLTLPWPVEEGRRNLLPFAWTEGKYDLTQFDDASFARLDAVVRHAERLGIICQVCLFDRCGLATADRRAWENNPYNADCNVNGVVAAERRDYPRFCVTNGLLAEMQAALVRRVVETLGDRRNVIYEIMNEPYPQLGALEDWHAWVARELRASLQGRPGSKLISSTGVYPVAEIDLFSMHRAGSLPHVDADLARAGQLGRPMILSDDGDLDCMFNPDVTRVAAQRAIARGAHFEHLEYTIALQREHRHLPASRLDQLPACCRLNLRHLAALATPLPPRPFLRPATTSLLLGTDHFAFPLHGQAAPAGTGGELSLDSGGSWKSVAAKAEDGLVSFLAAGLDREGMVRAVVTDDAGRDWPGPAQPVWSPDLVFFDAGDPVREVGLMRIRPYWSDGDSRVRQRGGAWCLETIPGGGGRYLYFRLDETPLRQAVRGAIQIQADYHDPTGRSRLLLEYDSIEKAYQPATPDALSGAGPFKRAAWTLRSAAFRGRQNNGADFRLSIADAASPLALRRVQVSVAR